MVRKLFIVQAGNERLYRALRSALANEPDVEISYDRRDASRAPSWRGEDRRIAPDLHERIREDGFGVVRHGPAAQRARNIRWA